MEDDIRARRAEERQKKLRKIWKIARPVLVIILSLAIALGGVYLVGKALYQKFLLPIDAKDATPIEITIPSGYGASYIGKVLYEEGLINNKAVFKVYVDFMGKSSSLRSGTYILSKNMDIAQMVDIMCTGNPPRKTIDLRVAEGTDVKMIGEQLVQLGVLESPEEFYELCKTGEAFMDFTFIAAIEDDPSEARKYKLEGYLFPDTYEIYSDSSPDVIINKMLVKFLEVFNVGYSERAEELGLTMDEVVTLASLVEREAKTNDFAKVSAVFHNRLKADMMLQSDAPLRYILNKNVLLFDEIEKQHPSLYNTYTHKGVPLGPITNPGHNAIRAVLYPEESYLDKYYYFCLKDSKTGELVFAQTLQEHNENVETYSPQW